MEHRHEAVCGVGFPDRESSGDLHHRHGFLPRAPEPMRCPPDVARQSLALYYFTDEAAPVVRSTQYRARPGDGLHGVAIYADKQLLRAYDWTKRHLGISDETAKKFLQRVEGLRRKRPSG